MSDKKLPRLLIFASGAEKGGGSGFENLVIRSRDGVPNANIVAVVSNHENGGVSKRAKKLEVQFFHSPKGRTKADYEAIIECTQPDFIALSGWLGKIEGHDPRTTFNIHPAYDLFRYGGKGMHGDYVHEAALDDFRRGLVKYHGITMHFATEKYDDPAAVFFKKKVEIKKGDTLETLRARVNEAEHWWQPIITHRVITGQIHWDGKNPESIVGEDIEM